jgi:hypothetical protein
MKRCIAWFPLLLITTGPALAQAPATSQSRTPNTPAQSQPTVAGGASQAPAAEPVDPAKDAAIRRLMDLTGAGKLGGQMVDGMMPQMRAMISQSIGQNARADQFLEAFFRKFRTHLTDADIVNMIVPVYARHFSLEDIQALIQFYESPVGQRFVEQLPRLTEESRAIGAKLGQAAAFQTLEEMSDDYPELKGLPRGGANPSPHTPEAPQPAAPHPN